jgi:formylglycine-generating enzyme required for sulfatase activity
MMLAPDFLDRTGYRLPTVTEWEYACRAGSITRWSLGEAEDLLTKYAWCVSNAWSCLHPVGTLRPNDLGLFDMHGNAWEWCQKVPEKSATDVIADGTEQPIKGGAFGHGPLTVLSISEDLMTTPSQAGDVGFRPVRTLRSVQAGARANSGSPL